MFALTVIVKLKAKVPVNVVVAGSSTVALSACGRAISRRVCGSKYLRRPCVPAAFWPQSGCVPAIRQAPTRKMVNVLVLVLTKIPPRVDFFDFPRFGQLGD